ncbi:HAD-IIIC family phosphatase [Sphingomonas sp. dw_22]|uniref:HAD-IIIC family phosphatase n=1 Tax=Sphingomonas sp. dw_22 TaxID=2721175 RepID=UPI001BD1FD16|nr:HAD-IIIC family phosphatase [Sphingomonas sp. dw_22]
MDVSVPTFPDLAKGVRPGLNLLLLGNCQLESIAQAAPSLGHTAHHQLMESLRHSAIPAVATGNFDAAVVSLTLRHIVSDATGLFFGAADMALARLQDESQAEELLERCSALIDRRLDALQPALAGLPSFVASFLEPSFNYFGTLIDPYGPTAPRAVMRELNRRFAALVRNRPNFYFLDINDLANAAGRMNFHDDAVAGSLHGSVISEAMAEYDRDRFEVPAPNSDFFDYPAYSMAFAELFWGSMATALAVIRQDDPVKLIVVDLDDTLWRGVAADSDLPHWARTEGWPIGFVEALLFFKRRGGLLAICSKNDRESTLERLRAIWHGALVEEDFSAIRINWQSKAENIAEIIAETNILAGNTLFIDDNPRELDEVVARLPDIRVLGGRPHDWRRTILCAPQTQVHTITAESSRRTELVRARASREAAKLEPTGSREEWLASLSLSEDIVRVEDPLSPEAVRAFELINKTNQFNTTGKRWTLPDFHAFLGGTGICLVASLKDRNVDNGIIGVSLIQDGEIVQTLLSCRVFGLGAEIVLGRQATAVALRQAPFAIGRIVDTGRNFTCHAYFEALGYRREGPVFRAHQPCAMPPWITTTGFDVAADSDRLLRA